MLAKPADEAWHAEIFRSSSGTPVSLEGAVTALRGEFGPAAALTLRLPPREGDALQAAVNGPWQGTVFFDAASGRELGRRAAGDGFFQFLFAFHSTLLAGDRGRALLALTAAGYMFMLATGLVLWWPVRWRHAFSVRRGAGSLAALFDLHRVAGATLGLLVFLSAATGAYLAWRPIAGWVSMPLAAPKLPRGPGPALPSLDTALRSARKHWEGGHVSTVLVPPRVEGAVLRLRVRLPDDPHPIGMSTLWLDATTGQVLASRRWSELDAGTRAFSYVYPLHTGTLGGAATQVLTFVAGAALAGYSLTGVWLWWRRRGGSSRAHGR